MRALVGYILIRRLSYKLKMSRNFWFATLSSLVSRFAVRMGEKQTLRKQAVGLLEDWQEWKVTPRLMQKKNVGAISYTETPD